MCCVGRKVMRIVDAGRRQGCAAMCDRMVVVARYRCSIGAVWTSVVLQPGCCSENRNKDNDRHRRISQS